VPWWDRCLNVSSDYMGGVIRTVCYPCAVLCVLQGQNKIFSISVFVTLFSEIVLYMFIEVLIICLCPVRGTQMHIHIVWHFLVCQLPD
jgi:hypothetical protein